MKKTTIEKLDLTIYEEILDNGMKIYLIPKNTVNDVYVTFTTKYGATNIEFIPKGKKEFYKSPYGIAHFLEHKLFEQKSGEDPFSFYGKNGCSNNAFTNEHNTTYLFSGIGNFEENLNYLLDFVQEPYFTDENVEKEKGIIIEELKMRKDNPYLRGLEKTLYNTFHEIPIRIPTIGTVEDINRIKKEDLYECYYTFYHPSNMFLTITGNFDVKETIEIIRKNQEKKQFDEITPIVLKNYNEDENVVIIEDQIKMNVTTPKLFIGFKIHIKELLKEIPKHLIIQYIGMYFDMKFGSSSVLMEQLKKSGIMNSDLDFYIMNIDDYLEVILIADTNHIEELQKEIEKSFNTDFLDENDFDRKKKCFLSSNIYMSDNIFKLNNKIINDILLENKILFDIYADYNRLNFVEMKKIIKSINFKNKSVLIISPLNTCQDN